MSDQLVVESAQPKSVSTFTISANGNELPSSVDVLSIVIDAEANRIPRATLLVKDGSAAEGGFPTTDGDDLKPGSTIEISAGYRNDEEVIFTGIVTKQSIKIRKNISVLKVECRHPSYKMTLHRNGAYYYEMSDLDVAEELCRKYDLDVATDGDGTQHEELVQYDTTDWDFMLCRAEANGFWVIADLEDKVRIAKPDFNQEPVLSLEYGATIKELDAEMDARLQYPSIKATSWDPAGQELLNNVESMDPGVPEAGNLSSDDLAEALGSEERVVRHTSAEEQELQDWANGLQQKQELSRIRGRLKTDGTHKAKPGIILEVLKTGERFEGSVLVSGVRHVIEKGNWETHIQFGESPELYATKYEVSQPPAAALIPPVHGLQIGVVTAIEGDPKGADRILVRLPMVNDAEDGAWMRLATLEAGADRGWVFRPEIGDEVIVGFIQDDPRRGIVLGSLHSSANAAPVAGADDNNEKAYVSKSGLRIDFDDDAKDIKLSTPGGNTLLLSENDQAIKIEDMHGNMIVLDQNGIEIKSIKDLKLNASQGTNIEAGTNAEISASANFKASGSAGAELSSAATAKVQGSIVQIN